MRSRHSLRFAIERQFSAEDVLRFKVRRIDNFCSLFFSSITVRNLNKFSGSTYIRVLVVRLRFRSLPTANWQLIDADCRQSGRLLNDRVGTCADAGAAQHWRPLARFPIHCLVPQSWRQAFNSTVNNAIVVVGTFNAAQTIASARLADGNASNNRARNDEDSAAQVDEFHSAR